MSKNVYVHAWEYVSPGPEAGGGGFNWWYAQSNAREAYAQGAAKDCDAVPADFADFLFTVQVSDETFGDDVTTDIDGELHELCARAATRRVGANVLAYWQANGFRMGDAENPATDDDGEGLGHVAPEPVPNRDS